MPAFCTPMEIMFAGWIRLHPIGVPPPPPPSSLSLFLSLSFSRWHIPCRAVQLSFLFVASSPFIALILTKTLASLTLFAVPHGNILNKTSWHPNTSKSESSVTTESTNPLRNRYACVTAARRIQPAAIPSQHGIRLKWRCAWCISADTTTTAPRTVGNR